MSALARGRKAVAAASLAVLMAGCASAKTTAAPGAPAVQMTQGTQTPGMAMTQEQSAGPSETASMVCGDEIKEDVSTILALHPAPTTTSTWADRLYTCTYHLAGGPLVLSVKESPDAASATAYLDALRRSLGATHTLTTAEALGNLGFESSGGTVVILKDGKTLKVDATGLPEASGPGKLTRADLAYEIASDILGCWSE